jgi:anaerobic sulfite reductase subunit B
MTYLPKKYKIENIKQYTPDVKLFKVKCNINPMPGTFLEVSMPGIGECPLASCSYSKNYLFLLTRNAGNVTSAMFNAKKQTPIFIRGPYGKGFPVEKIKNKNLVLVAGGTGIAPITSLISYIEQNRKLFGEIYIYFGFRDEKNILLKEQIDLWKKKFNVFLALSNDEKTKLYEKGFVHELIKKHPPKKDSIALLCGPEIMMSAVSKELNSIGIENNKIYWSLERRMECAFGSCGRCQIQDVYVCKDGPVFTYDEIKPRLDNENKSNEVKG